MEPESQSGEIDGHLESGNQPSLAVSRSSFFSITPSNLVRANQYFNLALAACLTVRYLSDPEASFMAYGFGLGVHLLSALVSENVGTTLPKVAMGANTLAVVNAARDAVSGDAASEGLALLGAGCHVFNVASEYVALRYHRR